MSVLNYITWDVSPWLYEGEHFAIGWYGVLATLASITLLLTFMYLMRKDKLPLTYALVLFIVATIMTYIFGHIVHCVFYEWYYDEKFGMWNLCWRNPMLAQPWKLFDLRHGGFASHGCVLGGILTALLLKYPMRCDFYWLFDRIMIGACAMLFVRMGNLMTGEIYGVPTALPWGFIFHEGEVPAHPTQIYEIIYFIVAYVIGIWLFAKKDAGQYRGLLSGVLLLLIFVPRFMIEFIKLPQAEFEENWALNMGQLLSIPFIIFGVVSLIRALKEGKQANIAPAIVLNHQERKKYKRR